jgi:Rieske 2Fe-2S family protein
MSLAIDETGAAPLPRAELEAMVASSSGTMLPRGAYVDDALLAWELEHFFTRSWVCAGRSSELAVTGARSATRIGNETILLVRGADGELRGFFNVCRHRGHELLPCGASTTRATIACPYHAWVYDLDGSLHSTPRFDAPDDFDPSAHALGRVAVEEWFGWVFVNASGDAGPLADHLGSFDAVVAGYEPERLVAGATHHYTMAANWKLAIENYHECFHCPAIHPELCRVSPPTSGENFVVTGLAIGGNMDLVDGAATMSMTGESPLSPLPGLSEVERRTVMYAGIFPNLLISLHPDYVMTHRIRPVAPGVSEVECAWLFDPDAVAAPGFDPSFAVDFWDVTNRQDWTACEGVQRGVESRGYRPGPFSIEEEGVAAWNRQIATGYLTGKVTP